ncbi:MAG: 30S ribosomal protein S17 [Elusimicrobiota bacterium]|jgi:small subunit ribosomal protein S17
MTTPELAKEAAAAEDRSRRKAIEGVVVSDRMDKTRAVRIIRRFRHPLYQKVLTRHTKVYAHDEKNETRTGDQVALMETRPLSKLKRWRVVEILKKGRAEEAAAAAPKPKA